MEWHAGKSRSVFLPSRVCDSQILAQNDVLRMTRLKRMRHCIHIAKKPNPQGEAPFRTSGGGGEGEDSLALVLAPFEVQNSFLVRDEMRASPLALPDGFGEDFPLLAPERVGSWILSSLRVVSSSVSSPEMNVDGADCDNSSKSAWVISVCEFRGRLLAGAISGSALPLPARVADDLAFAERLALYRESSSSLSPPSQARRR